jgi:parallel beta-helix repeat protein
VVLSQPLLIKEGELDSNSSNRSILGISAPSCDKSDYTIFTGSFVNPEGHKEFAIYINDQNPNYNWNKTVTDNSWATGSGTYSDPYIIENLYISGDGQAGMIGIAFSKKYFIIQNCWFNYSGSGDAGIDLYRTSNGTIINNVITYTDEGIDLSILCQNNTISNNILISDNTLYPGSRAFSITTESNGNLLYNNKILNYEHPLYMAVCENNTIDRNYAENTILNLYEAYPIHVGLVNYTQVTNNVLAGAFAFGSFEVLVVNSVGNTISNNSIIVNGTYNFNPCYGTIGVGLPKLQQESDTYGIYLGNSNHNLVANNVMIIDAENGGAISGYDIFIIVGIISVVSIVGVLFKRLKH